MKKLGFGAMRLPLTNTQDPSSVNYEETCKMVDSFIERGFTYFDTAWMYCGEKSEVAMRECLVKRHSRNAFTLTSKLPGYMLHCDEDCDKIFNIQREKTGVEYFDYYLLHNLNVQTLPSFEKNHAWDWIKAKKEQGLIRHIGFSYHDGPELLEELLIAHPEMEIVQLQINYLDWESMGVQSRKCHEVACKYGKQVIVMEPVKGGMLANVPQEVESLFKERDSQLSIPSWAIRFAASQENVMMVLSGMSNTFQLDDNTSYMADFKPLSTQEIDLCLKAAEIINSKVAIACTGCSYCTVHCPQQINIPRYFSLYNTDKLEKRGLGWTPQENYFANMIKTQSSPRDCVECGECEELCPQHLPIREYLKEVANHFMGIKK